MGKKVLCVGALIVDIINDAIDRILSPGEGVSTIIGVHLGGNAYNVAVDLAKLGMPRGQVCCVGAVGDDHFGGLFKRDLERYGIIPQVQTVGGSHTSRNVILQVKGEERRYHFDEGANPHLDFDFVIDVLRSFAPDVLCIGEFGCLGQAGARLEELFAAAKDLGCLVVADAVIASDGYRECLRKAAPLIDVLHCNEHEAKWITGLSEMEATVKGLQELGITLPTVSQGDRDLLVGYDGYRYSVPAFKASCTDPTGAGDAFTAGLVKKLFELAGASVEEKLGRSETNLFEAVLFGAAAGAACVTALGCTPAVDRRSVSELLESQSKDVLSGVAKDKL